MPKTNPINIFKRYFDRTSEVAPVDMEDFISCKNPLVFTEDLFYLGLARSLRASNNWIDKEESALVFQMKLNEHGSFRIARMALLGVISVMSIKVDTLGVCTGNSERTEEHDVLVEEVFNYCIIAAMLCNGLWPTANQYPRHKAMLIEVARWQIGGSGVKW